MEANDGDGFADDEPLALDPPRPTPPSPAPSTRSPSNVVELPPGDEALATFLQEAEFESWNGIPANVAGFLIANNVAQGLTAPPEASIGIYSIVMKFKVIKSSTHDSGSH